MLTIEVIPRAIIEKTVAEMQALWNARAENPDPDLNRRMLVRTPDGEWWKELAGGVTIRRNEAHIYEGFASVRAGEPSMNSICEILENEDVPQKGSLINKLFAHDFIRMLEAAPKNEMVRGWILKVTKQLPPEDCDTVDKIEEWLQSIQKESKVPLKAPGKAEGFSIPLDFNSSESGRCDYTVDTYGSDDFDFTDDELREMTEDADGDFDNLIADAKQTIDDCWNERCDARMEPGDNYNYGEHNAADGGDTEYDYNISNLKDSLRAWVRENMPEEWARMQE
jgi:hypothetical protein